MGFFTELFAWWTGNTIGTRLYTWRKGERVGEDGLGNVYYRERGGKRRWVIYRTLAEPSQVPPEVPVPPSDVPLVRVPLTEEDEGTAGRSSYGMVLRLRNFRPASSSRSA